MALHWESTIKLVQESCPQIEVWFPYQSRWKLGGFGSLAAIQMLHLAEYFWMLRSYCIPSAVKTWMSCPGFSGLQSCDNQKSQKASAQSPLHLILPIWQTVTKDDPEDLQGWSTSVALVSWRTWTWLLSAAAVMPPCITSTLWLNYAHSISTLAHKSLMCKSWTSLLLSSNVREINRAEGPNLWPSKKPSLSMSKHMFFRWSGWFFLLQWDRCCIWYQPSLIEHTCLSFSHLIWYINLWLPPISLLIAVLYTLYDQVLGSSS